ncbi:MAG: FAD-dependent oxidoreductase [Marinagarivorans sp.]|nr:FAD-dependent oxidoreductase [Marinagarivorans sp.]
MNIRFNTDVERIEKLANGDLSLTLNNGENITAQAVLFATGRKPKMEQLLADGLELTLTKSQHIKVNDTFQTSIPSIYAVGDVTGGMELTPVALKKV